MSESFANVVLIIHAAATLFMTGVIWFVQIVHYPLMDRVTEGFPAFEKAHGERTSRVVAVPMLVELFTAVILVFFAPPTVPRSLVYLALLLLGIIWASTFLLQVPAHNILGKGFDAKAHRMLVNTNWVRTVCWSFRSLLVLWMIYPVAGLGN